MAWFEALVGQAVERSHVDARALVVRTKEVDKTSTDHFREWLAERARIRSLSHAQLAMRCGIDRSTVSRIMKGNRQPTLDTAIRLLRVLEDRNTPPTFASVARAADPTFRLGRVLHDDPLLSAAQCAELLQRYREMRNTSSETPTA